MVRHGASLRGAVGFGVTGQGKGVASRGAARNGEARCGRDWNGIVTRQGQAGFVRESRGKEWSAKD